MLYFWKMAFNSNAQDFVVLLKESPLLCRKTKEVNEDGELTCIPSLDKLLLIPEDKIRKFGSSLGLNEECAGSVTMIIQSLIYTRETKLSLAQCRPESWNVWFRGVTESVVGWPQCYDSLLRESRSNRERKDLDRALVRLIMFLHIAFADRMDELRELLSSYFSTSATLKEYYKAIGNDVSWGEGPSRLDKAVAWNIQISSNLIKSLILHMAFNMPGVDGFEFYHMRQLTESAHCGLYGTLIMLNLCSVPSGVMSIALISNSFVSCFIDFLDFLLSQKEQHDWFYPGASKLFDRVSHIQAYRPHGAHYSIETIKRADLQRITETIVAQHPILENAQLEKISTTKFNANWVKHLYVGLEVSDDAEEAEIEENKKTARSKGVKRQSKGSLGSDSSDHVRTDSLRRSKRQRK